MSESRPVYRKRERLQAASSADCRRAQSLYVRSPCSHTWTIFGHFRATVAAEGAGPVLPAHCPPAYTSCLNGRRRRAWPGSAAPARGGGGRPRHGGGAAQIIGEALTIDASAPARHATGGAARHTTKQRALTIATDTATVMTRGEIGRTGATTGGAATAAARTAGSCRRTSAAGTVASRLRANPALPCPAPLRLAFSLFSF